MYEHSVVEGIEQSPDGSTHTHAIHFYDVGIAGDGLRAPCRGPDGESAPESRNEHQVFLAHLDAPEVWDGPRLVDGGKHYGHLEANVYPDDDGSWKAELTPVYVFPLMDDEGNVTGWERRVYDDVTTLTACQRSAEPEARRHSRHVR
jgi:hypothetical protein